MSMGGRGSSGPADAPESSSEDAKKRRLLAKNKRRKIREDGELCDGLLSGISTSQLSTDRLSREAR